MLTLSGLIGSRNGTGGTAFGKCGRTARGPHPPRSNTHGGLVMTLSKDNRSQKPEQNRTQKIVMWSVFGVAAVLFVIAVILFVTSGAKLF